MKYSVWALVFPRNAILQALLNEYMQVSFFNVRKMAAYRLARLPKVHFSTRFAETSAMELRFSNQPERTLSLGFDTCLRLCAPKRRSSAKRFDTGAHAPTKQNGHQGVTVAKNRLHGLTCVRKMVFRLHRLESKPRSPACVFEQLLFAETIRGSRGPAVIVVRIFYFDVFGLNLERRAQGSI